jgi:[protein-PII] uridylyltransferase
VTALASSPTRREQQIDAAGPDGTHRGLAYCRRLCDITDEWVVELFDRVMAEHRLDKGRVALLATGGYGRGELAPFSDLDLLLVHDLKAKEVRSKIEPIASALWYPLWDAGVKLGHAVRTLKEQVELAKTDLDSATALLTARPLGGDDELAREVVETGRMLWSERGSSHIEALRARVRARESEESEVAYRLDPDLKDGHGGLRDVQSLWWANAAGMHMSAGDEADLTRCYDVLLRARVALHLSTERTGDILRLEDQDATAKQGGWTDADALMASVAAAGRTVAWLCEENWGRGDPDRAKPADRAVAPGVVLLDGEIELASGIDPAADQRLVLQAAVAAARNEVRIGRATLDLLHREIEGWPGNWPVGATDELVALLLEGHRAIPVLEALDQRELFGRLLPEWEPVRSKPQRNAYHRFTVDRHLWEAAANAAERVDRVGRPDLLVMGALLHDIGKGYPGDHTEAGVVIVRQLAPRLGYSPDDVETLVAMVEHHLLLPDAAIRRDLTDSATIERVAEAVGTVERLELLHALTESDSLATGPAAWGSWQAELVGELVARVRHVLGGGDAAEVTWRLFPDADTLARMAVGAVDVRREADLITVVSPDRTGSFSRVAGVLSLHGLDVISAQAHSDEHGMAASQFRVVSDDADLKWRSVKSDLARALANELAIEARLAERATAYRRRKQTQAKPPGPPRVAFDDEASSNATVIVVRAQTKVGILHRITKALSEFGLDIRHATVQSIGMEVVDTFYVRTANGGLVTDPFHRKEIERALLYAVA